VVKHSISPFIANNQSRAGNKVARLFRSLDDPDAKTLKSSGGIIDDKRSDFQIPA
jgi:hypothetical protein